MQEASDKSQVPPIDDLWEMVKLMNERLSVMEHRHSYVSQAFPKNDLGKPDYDGHRKAHNQLMKDAEVVSSYQQDVVKKVLGWAAIGVLTLLLTGGLQWLKDHLK